MKKSEIINKIKEQGLVVVVRGDTKEEGINASIACIKGGIKCIEVAYTNNNAGEIIKELNRSYKNDDSVCIGAGTVLDAPTARNAIMNGARYIVSPSFNYETAVLCNRYAVPYIPGCMTITEIVSAMETGVEIVKLFPGSAYGPKYISAIKGPLPHVSLMVTGGVNRDNAAEWFEAVVDAIGIGGEFNKLAAKGEYNKITEIANEYTKIKQS